LIDLSALLNKTWLLLRGVFPRATKAKKIILKNLMNNQDIKNHHHLRNPPPPDSLLLKLAGRNVHTLARRTNLGPEQMQP